MRHFLLFFSILLGISQLAASQQFTDSNLPIIIINTDNNKEIPDDPRILATMKIIYRGQGQRNYVSDQNNALFLNYNGRIDIETRGSSSQALQKKPYGFTTLLPDNITHNNVTLLGLPSENDWILNSLAFDPSCIRDYLSYNLSRLTGNYATRTVFCEVIINGDYKGLYLLQEKIKADKNRVDITKISPLDIALPDLSGGYITKADKPNGDPVAWTMQQWYGGTVDYIHELPKPEDVTQAQHNYIYNQFQLLAANAYAGNSSAENGYPSIIDIPSFIDYIILNELASNPDAYQYSTYFHKDRNGKLMAGPIWDMNLTYGNDLFLWGYDRSKTNVWQLEDWGNDGSRFWRDLFHDAKFRCYLAKRWNELTQPGQPLSFASMELLIDETVNLISEALAREDLRWGGIGDHPKEISGIKAFLSARIKWINLNIGTYSSCADVTLPPLVISKIMYNPQPSADFPESDDLEFIEISNNTGRTTDLTGIYFSGKGLVFQFPAKSTIGPFSSRILASNASAFQSRYGFLPFGEFSRNLSNKGEKIELSDAFGNVIDYVCYADSLPWPDADGNGKYLSLFSLSFDNALAESWETEEGSPLIDNKDVNVIISPNPVARILNIKANTEINSILLYNVAGNIIYSAPVNCESYDIDMGNYARGVYIIKILTSKGYITEKVVKL